MAAITRVQGVLALLPLLYVYYRQYRASGKHDAGMLSLLLIPGALLGFMLHLYWLTGNLFASLQIQNAWGNAPSSPFAALAGYIVQPKLVSYWGWDLSVLSFVSAVGAIILTLLLIGSGRVPGEYVLLAVLSIYVLTSRESVVSSGRFAACLFPMYLGLGMLAHKRSLTSYLLVFTFAALQTFLFVALISGHKWAST